MKTRQSEKKRLACAFALCGAIFTATTSTRAGTIFTINDTIADAFLASGPSGGPNLSSTNYGLAGTLAIAPAGSAKGEFDSIIEFNTAAAASQFNATYGPGNWQITAITLSLASNQGTQGAQMNTLFNPVNGGQFGIDWLGYNSWVEGTGNGMGGTGYPNNSSVSFNSISTLFSAGSDSLGTFSYSPPGNNVYVNYSLPLDSDLTSEAVAGEDVSLYFFAADNQISYLFNSKDFSTNHPELAITATAIPEPGTLALTMAALGCIPISRRLKQRQ